MKQLTTLFILMMLAGWLPAQNRISIDTIKNVFYYDYNFQQDSTDSGSERYQEMVLQVGKKYSKFTSRNALYTDSLLFTVKDLDPSVGFSAIWPKISGSRINRFCDYSVYKNYPHKGNIQFVGKLGSKTSLVVNEEIKLDWQLEEVGDTTILGYTCQKAKCYFGGRNYEAWYTMEIPISEGPYKFNGLPGLIVRVADVENENIFQLYGVKNYSTNIAPIYAKTDKLQTTTAQGFARAMKVYIADLYRKYGGNPNIKYSSRDGESKTLRNIRAKNNYIERY
ncbi:MAG: GLPGLI family protein [Salinivirgaceae bacterium]|nr:GLPGLI family protein [Salinivirgaceae bacterium]